MKRTKKVVLGNFSSQFLVNGKIIYHLINSIRVTIIFPIIFIPMLPLTWLTLLPLPIESKMSNAKVISSPRKLLSLDSQQSMTSSASFQEDTFILNLINQEKFFHCSLAVFQDKFDNGVSVDRILESVSKTSSASSFGMKSGYTIKYNFPDQSKQRSVDTKLNGMRPQVRFPISISNYRRKSDPCLVVILMVNDIRSEFLKQIANMLTPVYIPITRKDEDFYVFKTDFRLHERLLFMPELPNRIKFKIAVGASKYEGGDKSELGKIVVKVRTVCFFCNPGGTPRLLDLPVAEQNVARKEIDYFPDFVWNLNGKILQVSLPYVRTKIEADPPWQGTSNARRGNWKMLFEKFLTIKFNFTYHMFVSTGKDGNPGGGGTGLKLKNGTWIGVTGDVISGKADLGIVVANTPKRILSVDFTNSFYDAGCLTFVTARPLRIYSSAALLWPFDWGMWVAIGFSTIFSLDFFFSIYKVLDVFQFGSGDKWSLNALMQFIMTTFFEQDSRFIPHSHALRSFMALWFFFTMVLTNVYRSKMVSLLAFPVLTQLPKTFEELAFSDYQVGFMKHGDSAYNTLAASTDPVYKKLVAEMEIFSGTGLECLEKVMKYKYGCIGYDFSMVYLRERNLSDSDTRKLVFAPARTYNVWLGLATESKSIYRMNFGKFLGYTRPFHLADIWDKMDMYYNVRKIKLEWWKETNQMDKAKHVEEESNHLTMKHIAGDFYVLVAGILIAGIVFVHEVLSFNRKAIYNGFVFHLWAVYSLLAKLYY